ncbi:hypothetical protein LT187_003483 [Acinetobacter baumannii]|nr:hypothetical protein [Acinetobacter baumannii]ELB2588063.1 hypothetical protein [Acinetobacter baumannii]
MSEFDKKDLDQDFLKSQEGQFLTWAHGLYQREIDLQSEARTQRSIDAAYYDGEQFTQEEIQEYERRNQKPRVFNEIKPTVDWILGGERRVRTDWAVMPRTEDDSKQSLVKSKLVKYIDDINNARWHRSEAFADMVKTGEGWVRICYEANQDGDFQIKILHEHWRHIVCDSNSRKPDMTDMGYMWCVKIIPLNTLINYFPEKKSELLNLAEDMADLQEDLINEGMNDELAQTGILGRDGSFSLAHNLNQSSGEREGVRVYEIWYKQNERVKVLRGEGSYNGEVLDLKNPDHVTLINHYGYRAVEIVREQMYCALYTDDTVLYRQRSPYKHNRFPFVRRYAYLTDKKGEPYGVIRSIRDPQSDLNVRRNRALFLMSTARVVMDKGAVDNVEALADELQRYDGIIEKNPNTHLEIHEGTKLASTHLDVGEQNSSYIRQISGVTGENRGMDTNATSGIAIQARQEQGTIITTVLSDMHSLARKIEGELVLSLIEQFMDKPMQFRITADNLKDKMEFVRINEDGKPETDITRTQADFVVAERDYRTTMRQALSEQLISVAGTIAQHTGNPKLAVAMLTSAIELQDLPDKDRLVSALRQEAGMPPLTETEEERLQREEQERQALEKQQQEQEELKQLEIRQQMAKISQQEAAAQKIVSDTKRAEEMQQITMLKDKLEVLKSGVSTAAEAVQVNGILPIVDQLIEHVDSILNVSPAEVQKIPQPPAEMQNQSYQP